MAAQQNSISSLRLVNKTGSTLAKKCWEPSAGGYRLTPLLWTIVYAEAGNHQSRALL